MRARAVVVLAVKLLVASLVVGLVFRALDIRPQTLLRDIPDVVRDVFRMIVHLADWATPYVLLGAMVVVPVWALYAVFRAFRRR